MFRARSTKTLVLLTFSATVLAIAGYVLLFLSIAATNRSISVLENKVDLVTQKESKLRSIEESIRETKDDRARLSEYLIAEDGIVSFIERIEGLSVSTGATIDIKSVDVSAIDASAPEEGAYAERVRLSFTVDGTWREVIHTLALLETLPASLSFSRMTLRAGSPTEDEPTPWNGAFTLTAVKKK